MVKEILKSSNPKNLNADGLKQDWEIKKLGEVCVILNGGTPKTNIPEYWDGDIHWITPADLGKLERPTVDDTPRKITALGLEKSSAKLFPENSVILSTRAPIGHLAINKVPMSTNQGCRGIVPGESINSWFLFYFLKMNVELLDSLGTGATFKELSTKALSEVEIPLPPISEQHRIVAILDEAFAAIARAKANAEQNLKNAKELFESYLQGVFEAKGDRWDLKKLSEITEVKDGTHDSPKYVKQGIPFVTQKNIKPEGLSFSDTKYISEDDHNKFYKRSNVSKGDILISMIGANRGMAAIVDDKRIFSIKNVGLIKSSENINMNYLLYYLKSSFAMGYVSYMSNGGAQEFVGLTALRNFPVPLPSIKVQQSIVRQLDALRTETQKLKAIYQKKIEDLEELKKSILQKAFAGELKIVKQMAV